MQKPSNIGGYSPSATQQAERVLVTLLRGLGPWRKSVFLIGGLAPQYIVQRRPPDVPPHAGTVDVDVVIDVGILAETEAYATLEGNLRRIGFQQGVNDAGIPVGWRWTIKLDDGATMKLELLAEDPSRKGGVLRELPGAGIVSAANIPHASIVLDLHDNREVRAELLGGGGLAVETVAFANVVSFTCLKAFAFNDRGERKDAHDLVYCLQHLDGGLEHAIALFRDALAGTHAKVVDEALEILRRRFCAADGDSYQLDGPVAVAKFEIADEEDDSRNRQLLRQRQASDVVERLLLAIRNR